MCTRWPVTESPICLRPSIKHTTIHRSNMYYANKIHAFYSSFLMRRICYFLLNYYWLFLYYAGCKCANVMKQLIMMIQLTKIYSYRTIYSIMNREFYQPGTSVENSNKYNVAENQMNQNLYMYLLILSLIILVSYKK